MDILGCRLPGRDVDEVTSTNIYGDVLRNIYEVVVQIQNFVIWSRFGGQKHTEDILSMGVKDILQQKLRKRRPKAEPQDGSSNIWMPFGRGGE